jgi:hypothetical protein
MSYNDCSNNVFNDINLSPQFPPPIIVSSIAPIVSVPTILLDQYRTEVFEPVFTNFTQEDHELLKNVGNTETRQKQIGKLLRLFKKSYNNFAATSKFESGPHNLDASVKQTKLEYDTLRKSLFPHVKEAVFDPASYSGAGIVICSTILLL